MTNVRGMILVCRQTRSNRYPSANNISAIISKLSRRRSVSLGDNLLSDYYVAGLIKQCPRREQAHGGSHRRPRPFPRIAYQADNIDRRSTEGYRPRFRPLFEAEVSLSSVKYAANTKSQLDRWIFRLLRVLGPFAFR